MAIQTIEAPAQGGSIDHEIPQSDLIVVRKPSELALTSERGITPVPTREALRGLVNNAYNFGWYLPEKSADPSRQEKFDQVLQAEYGGDDQTDRAYFLYRGEKLAGSLVLRTWEKGTPEGDKYWDLVRKSDPGFVKTAEKLGRTRVVEIKGLAVSPADRGKGIEAALLRKALPKSAAMFGLMRDWESVGAISQALNETTEVPRSFFGTHTEVTPGYEKAFVNIGRREVEAFLQVKGLKFGDYAGQKRETGVLYLAPGEYPGLKPTPLSERGAPAILGGLIGSLKEAQGQIGHEAVAVNVFSAIPEQMSLMPKHALVS